jgi:uncharacterized membrane-anchored protein
MRASHNSLTLLALGAVCGMQLLIVTGKILAAEWPRHTGEAVLLRVRPVDPRSLLRGDYVRLDYEIGRLPWELLDAEDLDELPRYQEVYVSLQRQGEEHVARRVSLNRPERGVFIRGRTLSYASEGDTLILEYGVEAYFATPERAQEIERELRDREQRPRARVFLGRDGRAALDALVP